MNFPYFSLSAAKRDCETPEPSSIPERSPTPFDLKTRTIDSAPGPERPAPNRGVPRRFNLIMNLKEILADPSISSWLKNAVKTAYEQDPIDALRDAHRLVKMLGERYTQVVNRDVVHRLISGRHTAVGDLADFQGASDEHTLIRT